MKDIVSLQPYLAYILTSARSAMVLQVNLNPLKLKEVTSLREEEDRHIYFQTAKSFLSRVSGPACRLH